MKRSITYKMALVLLIAVLLIMTGTGVVSYFMSASSDMKDVKTEAMNIKNRLLNSLRDPLWNYDDAQMETVIELEMENKNVLAILLYSDSGSYINGRTKDALWRTIPLDYANKGESGISEASFFNTSGNINRNNNPIGSIKIFFTRNFIDSQLRKSALGYLFQAVLLSIIILIIVFFSIKLIILDNVLILNSVVDKFAKKDFASRARIKSEDELGHLAESFNYMAKTIQEYSENMEQLVAERTEELRKSMEDLNKANLVMKEELEMAKIVQQSIIPKILPETDIMNISGYYMPMEDLGGDYYDIIEINEEKMAFVIADVCGHGVPSALVTTMAKMSFRNHSNAHSSPEKVVEAVNKELLGVIKGTGYYLTAFYCVIDTINGKMEYTSAGHDDMYIVRANGDFVSLKSNSFYIGLKDMKFKTNEVNLVLGDKLVLYTDGITEAQNEKGGMFGDDRFMQVLRDNIGVIPIKDVVHKVIEEIDHFTGFKPAADDRTILIIDILSDVGKIHIDLGIASANMQQSEVIGSDETADKFREMNDKYFEAASSFKKGNYDKSIDLLLPLVNRYNRKIDNFNVLNLLGHCFYKLDKFDKAMEHFEVALSLNPEDKRLNHNIVYMRSLMDNKKTV